MNGLEQLHSNSGPNKGEKLKVSSPLTRPRLINKASISDGVMVGISTRSVSGVESGGDTDVIVVGVARIVTDSTSTSGVDAGARVP